MSGLKSRDKGKRGEYQVRDYFRALGYVADRVPMSGAAQGFKGDIRVKQFIDTGDTVVKSEFTVEVKCRKSEFDKIYQFLRRPHTPSAFIWNGVGIAWSPDFKDLPGVDYYFSFSEGHNKDDIRILNKIVKLRDYLQTCDYLVIKGDRQPLLFFRFV